MEETPDDIHLWFSFNVDDMNGEELGYVMEKLMDLGARDVSFTPIFMKKNRPAYRLDVIATMVEEEKITEAIFAETTTLGIKKIPFEKMELERSFHRVNLDGYDFIEKRAVYHNVKKSSLEYEEVKAYAQAEGMSLQAAFQRLNNLRMKKHGW